MRTFFFAAFMAIVIPAQSWAASIDIARNVTDITGQPAQQCVRLTSPSPGEPAACALYVNLTIGGVIAEALDRPEPGLKASDISERGIMAVKIRTELAKSNPAPLNIDQHYLDIVTEELPKMGLINSEAGQIYQAITPAKN